MAPRKRTRDVNDVDGDVEIESASSSFRQTSSKRSKVALARENGGSVVSDDEDSGEINDMSTNTSRYGGISLEHSEDEDDEIDELRATQIIQKQMEEYKENMACEQGVIEEVYCRNFMCHTKLRIRLGPLINFIIGHNGSGKSAVLTALTMCLGGKATTTNRGASLKSFIKEGEDSATLAVKIKNQGDGAYKPELYGASITVERNFTRNGTTGYKLKNAQDKIISTKRADLDDIQDFFAFQLDNPINVLNQDMARQFLSNSTPADKYKFFIRGTQLEVLDADYKLLEEHLDSIVHKLHSREQDIELLKQRSEEAEKRKRRLEATASTRQKIKDLQHMHAWAQVEEQEAELAKCETKVTNAQETLQARKDAAEDTDGTYEGHNQSYEAAKHSLSDFQAQLEPLNSNHKVEKDSFDKNKDHLMDLKAEERRIKEDHKKGKADVKKAEDSIKAEQERLAAAEGPEQVERLERLEQLKQAAEEATRAQMEHGTGIADLERKKADASQRYDARKPQVGNCREDVRKAQERLANAQQQQPRPFAGFRQGMQNLVRAIDNETRWRTKPVGPVGMHIKLKKQEWASQLERTFGGALDSFVVICKEDADMLTAIMRRVNCTPGVLIGSATPLDTMGKLPEDAVDTILSVLEIENDLVRNQLIINQNIEQTVLIPRRAEAYRYAYEEASRPRNVKVVMCQDDNDRKKGLRFEWSRSGASKTSPVLRWDNEFRIKANRDDQIATFRDDVEQAKRSLTAAEEEVRQLRTVAEKAGQEVNRFKKRQNDLLVESQQAEDAVMALQNEIDASRPQDGKLQELENQLASAKEDLEAADRSFMDMVNEKDRLGGIGAEIKQRMDAAEAELNQANRQVSKAERRVGKIEEQRREALRAKNEAHAHIEEAQQELTRKEKGRDEMQAQVTSFISQAEAVFARVNVEQGMTPTMINDRIEKMVEQVRRAEKDAGGTQEELLQAYHDAKREYDDAAATMKDMDMVAKTLRATLRYREYRWKMFRKYISSRARTNFSYLLSTRAFRGRVLLSHGDKELDIKVEPDLSKSSDSGRATKTLSGGEKSFSTICLLLSIWEAMGSPIRCLDEFDVFMDSVNRAESMKLMISAARRSVGRQFILITPQSMSSVEMGDDVKVHKMSDPERGQTVLPFGGTQAA